MLKIRTMAEILKEEAGLTLGEQAILFGLSVAQYYLLRKRDAPIGRKRLSILTREYPHIVASASKHKTLKGQNGSKRELHKSIAQIEVQIKALSSQIEALKVLIRKAS